MEIDMAQHPGGLHHAAQLDLAPLAAGAVGPQGGLERPGGAQQLLVGQPGFLQLLGQLPVLLQPVPLQQGHLVLHMRELLPHRRERAQTLPSSFRGLAQLPVLRGQQPPLGVGRGELGADLGEPGDTASKSCSRQDPAPEQHVNHRGAGDGADEQHEQGKNQSKSVHAFTLAAPRHFQTPGRRQRTRTGGRMAGTGSSAATGRIMLVALTIGIVGLPNVGKSTLFNALTRNQVLAANYPFATIEPNVGVVTCRTRGSTSSPNLRLPAHPARRRLVRGHRRHRQAARPKARAWATSSSPTSARPRPSPRSSACFDDPDVVHVDGKVDPRSDMETINTELILADLQTLEKAIPRVEKEVKIKKRDAAELAAIKAAQAVLERGDTIFRSVRAASSIWSTSGAGLLTAKPFIYVFNADEGVLGSPRSRRNCAPWWPRPTRSSSTPSSSPTSSSSTRKRPAKCWR